MGVLFCDELAKPRQKLYWDLLRDRMTIEEWEYACEQAMSREAFHKTPLPSVLLDYARELRGKSKIMREEMDDGSHTTEQLLALREPLASAEDVRELIRSIWPD